MVLSARFNKIQQVLKQRQPDLTVLMEDIRKPHNFAAITRTCEAVGILATHGVNGRLEVPEYSSVAMGSDKWVKNYEHPNLTSAIDYLRQREFKIYAAHLSPDAIPYDQVDYTQPTAILMGTERAGVSPAATELADGHIIIPMVGMVQSLNVSVAAAVILFEAHRQRSQAGMYDQCRLSEEEYQRILFEWCYPDIAAKYRQDNKPYPALDAEGQIISSSC